MSRIVVLAGAAAAVAVAVGAVAIAMPKSTGVIGGPGAVVPSASPSPSPTTSPASSPPPSATAAALGPLPSPLDTSAWKTHTSNYYGFTIAYPKDWTTNPATTNWGPSNEGLWPNPAWEHFLSPDGNIGIGVFSVPVTPGTTVDTWLTANCPNYTAPCSGIRDRAVDVTMDSHPALLVPFNDDLQVFSVVGDRMWVIASGRPAGEFDSLRLIESYLSTMHILPGGPAPSSSSSSPSGSPAAS